MTYEIMITHLNNNHFYPKSETKSGKIVGLQVDAPPILMDDKKKRIEEVLKDYPVIVSTMKNEGYLHIKLKAKK